MNTRSTLYVALGIFAVLTGSWSVNLWAEQVILKPGWIVGQADMATDGQIVQSLSVNASGIDGGAGNAASKSTSQGYTGELTPLEYSLTVQGYDPDAENWEYRVRATATARTDPAFCPVYAPNCRYAYTNIYFSDRYFPVAIGQTVANDYAASGTIQFQMDITDASDPSIDNIITGWRAYGYAYKNVPTGQERTNSRSYTHSSYTPCGSGDTTCGIWEMPVVSNAEVRVYASITVYGNALRDDGTRYSYAKGYGVHTSTNDLYYVDVDTDETNQLVIVPLPVQHVAPPPPPIVEYDYGAVEGTVYLNLLVDDVDYSEQFFTYPTWPYSYHSVWGRSIYTNPGVYLNNNVRTGTYTYRPSTRLWDDNQWLYLTWPYTDGDPANDRVTVLEGQTTEKNFTNETGILTGKLHLQGSLKTKELDWYQLNVSGVRYYEPGVGWVNQPTYGGSSYDTVYPDPGEDKSYRMFLTPGPWQAHYLRARADNTDLLSYSGWSDITIYDYDHYYDGSYYDFGDPVDVLPGAIKHHSYSYDMGGVSMCYEVLEDSLNLRSPYVSGYADFYNQDAKREMRVNVTGRSTTPNMPDPEAILYGPEGDYFLTPRAYTEDNTYITFPTREVTLSQKVFKRRCLTSPDMTIDEYVFDVTTDIGTGTATATVSGNATDDDGILRIEFWVNGVKAHVIDYSATAQVLLLAQTDVTAGLLPTSVDFSYDFELTAGLHTLRVVAVDGFGNESYDEWEVEVNAAPVANGDSLETPEDTPLSIAVATLLANDSDIDGDTLSLEGFTGTTHGALVDNGNDTLTYTPADNYWGPDSFTYTVSDGRGGTATATVTIDVTPVNDPPVASDDAYITPEDVELVVGAPGVFANDEDIDSDPLTASISTAPAHGTVTVNPDGSFSYTPDPDYYGADSFDYFASDGNGGIDTATVSINVTAVNDPPVVSVDVASQSVQYSDGITQLTISAEDIDSSPEELTETQTPLPSGLSLSGDCSPTVDGSTCTWTLDGAVLAGRGTHGVTLTLSDGEYASSVGTEVIVVAEDASAAFDDANPASVGVASDGGNSGLFALVVHVTETTPDLPTGQGAPGDISLADVTMELVPVGPGGVATPESCTSTSTDGTVSCSFNGVPVETYTVEVTIGGNYYIGSAENVLTVYDPSLGFTTGGGWFYWPDTSEKTNFGYTMKYGKKGTDVKGSLLLIRHLADGQKYRIKSNALSGLAIGEDASVPYGWASFSGKCTYLEPGMLEAEGNHGFTVRVEDHNEPGTGTDRVWITTRAKDGSTISAMSLAEPAADNAVGIQGGNIVAPH